MTEKLIPDPRPDPELEAIIEKTKREIDAIFKAMAKAPDTRTPEEKI